uniref:Uncharacterized protein n=1 Tax=Rhipicephalus pulchellus TaxID=72859 RepID=L7LXZ8_RHIPC
MLRPSLLFFFLPLFLNFCLFYLFFGQAFFSVFHSISFSLFPYFSLFLCLSFFPPVCTSRFLFLSISFSHSHSFVLFLSFFLCLPFVQSISLSFYSVLCSIPGSSPLAELYYTTPRISLSFSPPFLSLALSLCTGCCVFTLGFLLQST